MKFLPKSLQVLKWLVMVALGASVLNAAMKPDMAGAQPSLDIPLVRTPEHIVIARQPIDSQVGPSSGIPASQAPTDPIHSGVFSVPLVALGAPSLAEDAAVRPVLVSYATTKDAARFAIIEKYLNEHPQSPYKASLQLNLGLNYYASAYFTSALSAYQRAWDSAKGDQTAMGKGIADRAFGELVHLHARLGHFDDLKALLSAAGDRVFGGASGQLVTGAHQGLWMMMNKPEDSFKCGPAAIGCIFSLERPGQPLPSAIGAARSTQQGIALTDVLLLANQCGLNFQMAKRERGATLVWPAVIHWKIGHYAALLNNQNGLTTIKDPTFNEMYSASVAAIDQEASGYFLIPAGPLPTGWSSVTSEEGAKIWGKGQSFTNNKNATRLYDARAKPCPDDSHMTVANVIAMVCSLNLSDTPVGYKPPLGVPVASEIDYNQREASQPAVFNYSNWGPQWNSNWLGYIETFAVEYPVGSSSVTVEYPIVHLPGGGEESYVPPVLFLTAASPIEPTSRCWMTRNPDLSWVRNSPDGSKIVFSKTPGVEIPGTLIDNIESALSFDGYFISSVIDSAGNALTLNYDFPSVNSALAARLKTIVDPLGQVTTLTYGLPTDVLKVTKITDPFGRNAQFTYDTSGRLISTTDTLGIVSQYNYQTTSDFISGLTTPYGTSNFTFGEAGNDRWVEFTDPQGAYERVEYPAESTYVAGPNVAGMTIDPTYKNVTNYWDKRATAQKSDTNLDPANATQFHWLALAGAPGTASGTLAAIRKPFENPVNFTYEGQTDPTIEGTFAQPTKVGRVLDDGTSQVSSYTYNALGKVTDMVDPLGRESTFVYESDNTKPGYLIDLEQVYQKTGAGTSDLLRKITYNTQHLPLQVTDASGQTTVYTYNSAGQVATVTDAKGGVSTFWYHRTGNPSDPTYPYNAGAARDPAATGFVVKIDGPLAGSSDITNFTYDAFGRVRTVTDTQGYTVTTDYDAFDRPTVVTYPDGTYSQIAYNRLDAVLMRDRRGRVSQYHYNSLRQVVWTQDPQQNFTQYVWCGCGALQEIIDPLGHVTNFGRDLLGRVTTKTFQDNSFTTYHYETTTSRLKSTTDAKNQTTNYTYNLDDTISQISYTNVVVATPSVSFVYDSIYPRVKTMTDGVGVTTFAYNPVPTSPTLGAGRLGSVSGPLASAAVSYSYDELGRSLTRSINGAVNQTSLHYDALGRADQITNPLGVFNYVYVNATGMMDHVTYPNGQRTNYSYYANSSSPAGNDDQRLKQIQNLTATAANLSSFNYTYDAAGIIQTLVQQNDAATALNASFSYDQTDRLLGAVVQTSGTTSKNYIYRYDAGNNRTSEQIDSSVAAASFNPVNELTGIVPSGPIRFAGSLSEPANVTVNGVSASVDASNNFSADIPLSPGVQTVTVTATDYSSNSATKKYQTTIAAGNTRTPTYDANGNLLSDGLSKTYGWNAANQLVSITIGSNVTTFAYNGQGQRIQEKLNGALIKQWVWADGAQPVEERDGSNNVTKRFFAQGEQIGAANYFLSIDHLGSVREMTDSTGAVRARYSYDPYGRQTKVSGDLESDFGYAGYFKHQASGLNLTLYRAYDPDLGRFLSRDPFGEKGGLNLYAYVGNNPMSRFDPYGLDWLDTASNFGAGFGDTVTLGLTHYLRNSVFDNFYAGTVNECSNSYAAGQATGVGTLLLAGGLGAEAELAEFELATEEAATEGVDLSFNTGHVTEHLEELGANSQEVEAAITQQIRSLEQASSSPIGSHWGQLMFNGVAVEYRAFLLASGTLNVGTYYLAQNPWIR